MNRAVLKQAFPRTHRFIAARLSPSGQFGLHLSVGVLLMALSVWLFGEIAEHIGAASQLSLLDARISRYLHGYAGSVWTAPLLAVTHAHAPGVVLPASALLGWFLYRRRERYWLYAMLAAVTGGIVLNLIR